jgi:DNA-binding CsgD family transcriptional regulator/PAS domain-containing protein
MPDYEALTALIYDAALDAGLWPRVLEQVSDAVHGGATALLMQNQVTKGGTGLTVRLDPAALRDYYGAFAGNNPLMRRNDIEKLRAASSLSVLTDRSVLPKEEFVRTEFYNEFSRPNGMHSALMIAILARDESAATVNIMRPQGADDFDTQDVQIGEYLRPHLGRAFEISLRLTEAGNRYDALQEFLDRSAHAVFLLDADGRICGANRAANQLLAKNIGLSATSRALKASTAETTRRLDALIASVMREGRGGSMSLPRKGEGKPLSALIAPVGKAGAALFDVGPRALLCVSDPAATVAPPAQGLRELFNLTQAEARVALELVTGYNTRAIAERLAISPNTVRVHLQRILEKTRTNRQADLVRILLRTTGMYPD